MMRVDCRRVIIMLVVAIVVILAAVTFLFLRGPASWQRQYYPLHHTDLIEDASRRHEVSPYLIAAVIDVESGWEESAQSAAGAQGLMQVMPATARELADRGLVDEHRYPPEDLERPDVNIEYGTAYLRYLVERYHEVEAALAAYNAGLANADRWADSAGDIKERIDFPETRNFVLKVSRAKDRYEALYPEMFKEWQAR